MPLTDHKVSVIVPVYNAEQYLKRCVDSLIAQTYTNLEIILVDDGSKDASGIICDEYERKFDNIKVFHKENGGSSSARNMGIAAAVGEYVGFCDSDDYVEKDMFENLLLAAVSHPEGDIFQIRSDYYSESGECMKECTELTEDVKYIPSEEDFRLLLLHIGDASFCTKLIKRSFLAQFAFEEGKLNEDFELLLRMLQKTDGVYQIGKVGYHIVLSDLSNTRGTFKTEFYDAMVENSDMARHLAEDRYPNLITEAKRFQLFQRLDYLLHIPQKMMKGNAVCKEIIVFLKRNRGEIRVNPYLSKKEKRNLLILSHVPRLSKTLHGLLMKIKKPGKTRVYEGAVRPENNK